MKITKKQIQALRGLILDMDELRNKPRRLFGSLAEFAVQFCNKDVIKNILEDIDEWQDFYYKSYRVNELLDKAMEIAKNVKKQKCSHKELEFLDTDEERRAFERGVVVASREILRGLNEHIIDELF